MRKAIAIVMIVITLLSSAICITSCTDNDDDCPICGGSGYYQKKDCPGC